MIEAQLVEAAHRCAIIDAVFEIIQQACICGVAFMAGVRPVAAPDEAIRCPQAPQAVDMV